MASLTTAVALSMATAAVAFVPSANNGAFSTHLMAFNAKEEIGVLPPVGYLDPLGLIENGPYGSPEDNFKHYRGVEVKHGRTAMIACVGQLVQQTMRFDGFISPSQNLKFEDIPNGLGALKAVPIEGWAQIAIVMGFHEFFLKQREGEAPGDFGTGYFGVNLSEEKKKRGLNVEIQNGRLAMLGILGMMASEVVHNGQVLAETASFS
uniref:Uncharacterized protein n=1 Tax=Pseudictyota dubia TaxID=2749911 RepID=A0A7R9Z394_9STRA